MLPYYPTLRDCVLGPHFDTGAILRHELVTVLHSTCYNYTRSTGIDMPNAFWIVVGFVNNDARSKTVLSQEWSKDVTTCILRYFFCPRPHFYGRICDESRTFQDMGLVSNVQ